MQPQAYARHAIGARPARSRTMSLVSVSSTSSFRSLLEATSVPSSPTVSQRPEKQDAYGSFVPVRSATTCLRDFATGYSVIVRSPPKRRRVTFDDSVSISSNDKWPPPCPQIPYITKTFPNDCPPSPTSSSSSIMVTHDTPTDLHPILAKLEKKSRFCTQTVLCTTCRKPGRDFPRCGKCGEMWCSRSCRLVGGKRHICPTT